MLQVFIEMSDHAEAKRLTLKAKNGWSWNLSNFLCGRVLAWLPSA
jgi:hypothetical protein